MYLYTDDDDDDDDDCKNNRQYNSIYRISALKHHLRMGWYNLATGRYH